MYYGGTSFDSLGTPRMASATWSRSSNVKNKNGPWGAVFVIESTITHCIFLSISLTCGAFCVHF